MNYNNNLKKAYFYRSLIKEPDPFSIWGDFSIYHWV